MLKFFFNGSPNPLKVVHFKHFAPATEYASQRSQFEARRHMFKHAQTANG